MENTLSDFHSPDSGTSNFCSSQIAVPSFSVFVESHIRHSGGYASSAVAFRTRWRTVSRNVPRAQRRWCSSWFYQVPTNS